MALSRHGCQTLGRLAQVPGAGAETVGDGVGWGLSPPGKSLQPVPARSSVPARRAVPARQKILSLMREILRWRPARVALDQREADQLGWLEHPDPLWPAASPEPVVVGLRPGQRRPSRLLDRELLDAGPAPAEGPGGLGDAEPGAATLEGLAVEGGLATDRGLATEGCLAVSDCQATFCSRSAWAVGPGRARGLCHGHKSTCAARVWAPGPALAGP